MSHVVTLEVLVTDLDALELAARDCGLELRRNQRKYKWYGRSVGDYPLPKGMAVADLGRCDHALSVVDDPGAYEIGLAKVSNDNGTEAYQLRYDFWQNGYGLMQAVGHNCHKLLHRYAYHQTVRKAADLGWSVASETVQADGSIKLEFEPASEWAYAGQGGGW